MVPIGRGWSTGGEQRRALAGIWLQPGHLRVFCSSALQPVVQFHLDEFAIFLDSSVEWFQ